MLEHADDDNDDNNKIFREAHSLAACCLLHGSFRRFSLCVCVCNRRKRGRKEEEKTHSQDSLAHFPNASMSLVHHLRCGIWSLSASTLLYCSYAIWLVLRSVRALHNHHSPHTVAIDVIVVYVLHTGCRHPIRLTKSALFIVHFPLKLHYSPGSTRKCDSECERAIETRQHKWEKRAARRLIRSMQRNK